MTCEAPEWLGNLNLIKRHFLEDPRKPVLEEGQSERGGGASTGHRGKCEVVSVSMPVVPSWLPLAGYLHCPDPFPLREEVVLLAPALSDLVNFIMATVLLVLRFVHKLKA